MQKRLGLDLEVPDEFGWMIGGYTVGEACFVAGIFYHQQKDGRKSKQLDLRFQITVRADDKPAMEYIQKILQVGAVYQVQPRRDPNPTASFRVGAIGDLYHVIVPLFEKYPLPQAWRKAHEFGIWKRLVDIQYHEGKGRSLGRYGFVPLQQSFWDKVEPLVQQIKDLRKFHQSPS